MLTDFAHKVLSKLPDPQIIAMNGQQCTSAMRSEWMMVGPMSLLIGILVVLASGGNKRKKPNPKSVEAMNIANRHAAGNDGAVNGAVKGAVEAAIVGAVKDVGGVVDETVDETVDEIVDGNVDSELPANSGVRAQILNRTLANQPS